MNKFILACLLTREKLPSISKKRAIEIIKKSL